MSVMGGKGGLFTTSTALLVVLVSLSFQYLVDASEVQPPYFPHYIHAPPPPKEPMYVLPTPTPSTPPEKSAPSVPKNPTVPYFPYYFHAPPPPNEPMYMPPTPTKKPIYVPATPPKRSPPQVLKKPPHYVPSKPPKKPVNPLKPKSPPTPYTPDLTTSKLPSLTPFVRKLKPPRGSTKPFKFLNFPPPPYYPRYPPRTPRRKFPPTHN